MYFSICVHNVIISCGDLVIVIRVRLCWCIFSSLWPHRQGGGKVSQQCVYSDVYIPVDYITVAVIVTKILAH